MKSSINNFLRNIEQNARAAADLNNAHMGADGLLICNDCGTPKQCRIEVFGQERIVPCLCDCEKEKDRQEKEQQKRIEQLRVIEEMRRKGFANDDITGWTFANANGSNKKVMHIMQNYVDNFPRFLEQGKGLLLHGVAGTGKTYAAACVANALIDNAIPCYMTTFARARNMAFENKQRYLDDLQKFKLLVLDDLGTEAKTEYMQEVVFSIVDARYRAGLPMIVTTNLTLAELKNPHDVQASRIYSRILERCFPVEVAGTNQRFKKINDDYEETKRLLGV